MRNLFRKSSRRRNLNKIVVYLIRFFIIVSMNKEQLETVLVNTVKLLLDDSNGISDAAYESLMQLIYSVNPESKALEYMAETEGFKGRKFLNEDFELA